MYKTITYLKSNETHHENIPNTYVKWVGSFCSHYCFCSNYFFNTFSYCILASISLNKNPKKCSTHIHKIASLHTSKEQNTSTKYLQCTSVKKHIHKISALFLQILLFFFLLLFHFFCSMLFAFLKTFLRRNWLAAI